MKHRLRDIDTSEGMGVDEGESAVEDFGAFAVVHDDV